MTDITPSVAPQRENDARGAQPIASSRLFVLRRRADFVATSKGRRAGMPSLNLQARDRADDGLEIRVGFTATKKVGNAVIRNRAKRRLRSMAEEILPLKGQSGWDYVLVARPHATGSAPIADLRSDFAMALERIHGPKP